MGAAAGEERKPQEPDEPRPRICCAYMELLTPRALDWRIFGMPNQFIKLDRSLIGYSNHRSVKFKKLIRIVYFTPIF